MLSVVGPIGVPELLILLAILLVIFGPKRLPGLGKSLGTGMREFKDSITGGKDQDDDDDLADADPPALGDSTQPTATVERDEAASRHGTS